jgi:multidrug transporter EmrE-like cation transporter
MAFHLKMDGAIIQMAPLFVVIICAIPTNYLLAEVVKRLPAATVYATFVGIGGIVNLASADCRKARWAERCPAIRVIMQP